MAYFYWFRLLVNKSLLVIFLFIQSDLFLFYSFFSFVIKMKKAGQVDICGKWDSSEGTEILREGAG